MRDKFYNFFRFINEYALYGLLFFLPVSNALVETFVGLIAFGFLGRKIIKPDFKYLRSRPNFFLLLFLFFSAFSLLNSGVYLKISLNALFGKWAQYLGICFIVQDFMHDQKIIRRGLFVFLFSATLTVTSGLSQYFFNIEFLRNRSIAEIGENLRAATSSFSHYNAFGAYLVVVLSLVCALLLSDKNSRTKNNGLLILAVLSTMAIVFTFSRGSWLAMFISFMFMVTFSGRLPRRLTPVLILIILLFSFPQFYERLLLTFKYGGDNDRFIFWQAAWKMIKEHPFFGIGAGTFMANFLKFLPDKNISYAHNCYLQIWAETGIFALCSFMGFVISFVYSGIRRFVVSRDFVLLGLLSGAVGFLVHSFFETNLYSLRLAVLFWVWIGLIIARMNNINNGQSGCLEEAR